MIVILGKGAKVSDIPNGEMYPTQSAITRVTSPLS